MTLPKYFKEFIELLNSNRVEDVIVGGYALAFHGTPRYTGDLDILVRRSPETPRGWKDRWQPSDSVRLE
jgi:hypothetical protein